MTQLTDKEILKACAQTLEFPIYGYWNPLEDDGDCARVENKCGLYVNCVEGYTYKRNSQGAFQERFTPGNDAERRRASCIVVARAQIEKETRT